MELLDYEKKHIDYLKRNAHECALFLNRNEEFPLTKPCSLVLVGNGVRNTIKGGTGSGDVYSESFINIETAFINAGFNVTSTSWLDSYDALVKSSHKDYIKECKKVAHKAGYLPIVYSMGFFACEKEHNITLNYEGDACIYVLSRNSGEGNDRRLLKGDVLLTDKEVNDILFLNKKFKKFLLVLNVGGVVDLSRIKEVSNILLLSQLGVVTSTTLVDIVLGKVNPSGKLTTTWTNPNDYPCFNEFGDTNDTYYKEGIYVGYRYFNTINKEVLYPFGYGKSYSTFCYKVLNKELNNTKVNVKVSVKNDSKYDGKEVMQLYISKPNDRIDNPKVELCAFSKTKLIKSNQVDEINISFDLLDYGTYDELDASYKLLKGEYIIYLGNSSINLNPIMKIKVIKDTLIEQLNNKCKNKDLEVMHLSYKQELLNNVDTYELDTSKIKAKKVEYKLDNYTDSYISSLSNEDLIKICLGNYGSGDGEIVGESSVHVVGGAGETTLLVPSLKKSLTMADGPAGIRLKPAYTIDKKGIHDVTRDPLQEKMVDFLPKFMVPFIFPVTKPHGEIHYQKSTPIPIGTALAQSYNLEFVKECGQLVKEEMDYFKVDLWLAPALNIHRNILCGRNFEYYSEDPLVSSLIASSIVEGVEENSLRGTTIKHFACNNQEFNRNNNNTHINERALREIYLKGFERVVKNAKPKAIMTSYNLINGTHASENYELLNDIVRCEWDYKGLIMTDWIVTGRSFCKKSRYPAPRASKNVIAGNDLTMPGNKKDYKDILKALDEHRLTRQDLIRSASRIYRSILAQKKD